MATSGVSVPAVVVPRRPTACRRPLWWIPRPHFPLEDRLYSPQVHLGFNIFEYCTQTFDLVGGVRIGSSLDPFRTGFERFAVVDVVHDAKHGCIFVLHLSTPFHQLTCIEPNSRWLNMLWPPQSNRYCSTTMGVSGIGMILMLKSTPEVYRLLSEMQNIRTIT